MYVLFLNDLYIITSNSVLNKIKTKTQMPTCTSPRYIRNIIKRKNNLRYWTQLWEFLKDFFVSVTFTYHENSIVNEIYIET